MHRCCSHSAQQAPICQETPSGAPEFQPKEVTQLLKSRLQKVGEVRDTGATTAAHAHPKAD